MAIRLKQTHPVDGKVWDLAKKMQPVAGGSIEGTVDSRQRGAWMEIHEDGIG
jgi:hypothetical protein